MTNQQLEEIANRRTASVLPLDSVHWCDVNNAMKAAMAEATEELRKNNARDGLLYALQVVNARRFLSRPPGYIAALDEVEIFIQAALERLKLGQSMSAEAEVQ